MGWFPMKVLCGTDFSSNAAQAGSAAAAIAAVTRGSVVILHALDVSGMPVPEDVLDSLIAPIRRGLEEEATRLREACAHVEAEVKIGPADEVILDALEKCGAGLAVVSHLGRRAPARWLLGSVAERVAESSPVPTLIVRSAKPFEDWARGERPLKILVGEDFSTSSEAALSWLKDFQSIAPCEITVLYLDWPPAERARLGVGGPYLLTINQPEVQSFLERDLRERTKRLLGHDDAKILVRAGLGRVEAALCDAARELSADLIVVGSHQRHGVQRVWHSSVSRGVLHHAPTNVLCVASQVAESTAEVRTVPRLSRVLAATDFSNLGNHAVPHAYSAIEDGGEVKLVHVIEPERSPNPLIGGQLEKLQTPGERDEYIHKCTQHLRDLVPPDAEKRRIKTIVEVLEDVDAQRAICRAAERFDADLICVGSHGRSGISEIIMGSVAHGLMKHSRRPLLVIRERE